MQCSSVQCAEAAVKPWGVQARRLRPPPHAHNSERCWLQETEGAAEVPAELLRVTSQTALAGSQPGLGKPGSSKSVSPGHRRWPSASLTEPSRLALPLPLPFRIGAFASTMRRSVSVRSLRRQRTRTDGAGSAHTQPTH